MSDGKETGTFGALAIDIEREGETMLVSLRGEADLLSATSLEDQLTRALESGTERVVVDLGALNFIDSISLRVLLKASLASRQDSDRLYFRRAGSQVERILEMSGVKQQLRFID